MDNKAFIILSIINGISLLGTWLIYRQFQQVLRNQCHVLGPKNREVVYTFRIKAFLIAYISTMVVFAILSYPAFWFSL